MEKEVNMGYRYKLRETIILRKGMQRGKAIKTTELAKMLGVSRETVYNWLAGIKVVSADYTAALCEVLDAKPGEIWELVSVDDEPTGQLVAVVAI
jgi:DNA-binding Xre family transcriptional regulator